MSVDQGQLVGHLLRGNSLPCSSHGRRVDRSQGRHQPGGFAAIDLRLGADHGGMAQAGQQADRKDLLHATVEPQVGLLLTAAAVHDRHTAAQGPLPLAQRQSAEHGTLTDAGKAHCRMAPVAIQPPGEPW